MDLHEFVLIITVALPAEKHHGRRVRPVPVTINEIHRTRAACMQRGRALDKIMKQRHTWACHEIDQD